MKYAIIGSGNIGTALARVFARQNVTVGIANSRGPASLASLAQELGANVVPQSLGEACEAEVVFLAVPFSAYKEVARQREQWNGKIIVDTMNTFHTPPEELSGRLSSELVSEAFAGARLVKAFNHLPAEQLGMNPSLPSGRQVIFVSSNDTHASKTVAAFVTELGFAPVELGRLDQGGVTLHLVGGRPGGLLFQNLATNG
ncbi:MAG TPA: NADPH-dependent F420 reductase [Acidobacteriaceae bacterium]|nr:NADPH-dependent F420 reductase [Acidobacteriaceae bacterium]